MRSKIPTTGEIIEFDPKTPEEILETWKLVSEYIKAYEVIKDQLKRKVPELVDEKGLFEHNGYQFRLSHVQRMNYDKTILKEVFDEDLLDVFLEPSKTKIDAYLKENLDQLGEGSTRLRHSMIAVGRPYQVIKLERL